MKTLQQNPIWILALFNVNMQKVVEPGLFEIFVGTDQLKGTFRVVD